ncbi:hypothetical protein DPMN_019020 [Dreissena polymorpha]|uniref:BEN domain-containing protein n=2 Tax=Dreissena polymorpha TaxID=45954 RepID=A0A9D4NHK5_DREPO|nr:hypothetical protein DPMN_019020 [Dreissena polymorpha]
MKAIKRNGYKKHNPIKQPMVQSPISGNIVQRDTVAAIHESTEVTEKIVSEIIQYETRLPKALAKAMRAVFTRQQLAECSFKGGITTKGLPRLGLPVAERDTIIDVISRHFEVDKPVVEQKMRSALHRFYLMFK